MIHVVESGSVMKRVANLPIEGWPQVDQYGFKLAEGDVVIKDGVIVSDGKGDFYMTADTFLRFQEWQKEHPE